MKKYLKRKSDRLIRQFAYRFSFRFSSLLISIISAAISGAKDGWVHGSAGETTNQFTHKRPQKVTEGRRVNDSTKDPETPPEGSERDLVHEEDEIYDEDGDLLISVQFSTLAYYFSSSIYTSALFFDEVHEQTGK
jgi:hypothetical protein